MVYICVFINIVMGDNMASIGTNIRENGKTVSETTKRMKIYELASELSSDGESVGIVWIR